MLSTEDKEMMKGLYESHIVQNGHELTEGEIKRTLNQIRHLEKSIEEEEETMGTITIGDEIFPITDFEINVSQYNHQGYVYRSQRGRYYISKKVNKKDVNFGTYDNKEDAYCIVEKLKDCGWDKNQLSGIWRETGIYPTQRSMSRIKRKMSRGLNQWLM